MHKAICKYIDASQRRGNKQSSGEERSRGARPCRDGAAGVGWTRATVEDTVPRGAGGGDPTLDGAPGFLSKVGGAVEANLQRRAHQAPPTVPSPTDGSVHSGQRNGRFPSLPYVSPAFTATSFGRSKRQT